MTKSDKKIADLEKRVKELEARGAVIIVTTPVVLPIPARDSAPWHTPIVTCTTGATSWNLR